MMIDIGLMPSTSGKPGGGKTGQNMSDYPLAGGKFIESCQSLITDVHFELKWADRYSKADPNDEYDEDLPWWTIGMDSDMASILAGDAIGMFDGDFATPSGV